MTLRERRGLLHVYNVISYFPPWEWLPNYKLKSRSRKGARTKKKWGENASRERIINETPEILRANQSAGSVDTGSIEYTKMHGCLSCVNCWLAAVLYTSGYGGELGLSISTHLLFDCSTREEIATGVGSSRLSTPVEQVKYLKGCKAPSHYCLAVHSSHLKSDSRVKDQNL